MFSKIVLTVLFLLTLFTRFYNLDWGKGLFFHPDENNMAFAISGLSFSDLNPHFFAYGQFPLYLVFLSQSFVNLLTGHTSISIDFNQAIIGLRIYSAIFSSLTILVFWFLSKSIFTKKLFQYIFILFLIFSPGLIQLAHFGTTESLLILVFSLSLFYAIKIFQSKKVTNTQILFCSIFIGAGVASKIMAIIFISPILISLSFIFLENKKNRLLILQKTFLLFLLIVIFSCLFSPFNLISFNEFYSTMKYETGVATGKIDVFYTRQFHQSIPYLFQINKIFPYALGLPMVILSVGGIFLVKHKKINLIFILSFLIYFLYTGQLFVKWFRFSSPVFPILIIFAVFFLQKIRNKFLLFILILISVIPGFIFLKQVYLKNDNRITTNDWITNNIPAGSHILSESRNVISLPLTDQYQTSDFDFYYLDSSPILQQKLTSEIFNADYILIPSRRLYKNLFPNRYPVLSRYYENLFNGNLGFKKVFIFTSLDSFFLDSNNAEETFLVFDHPQIFIFKKDQQFNFEQYQQILKL